MLSLSSHCRRAVGVGPNGAAALLRRLSRRGLSATPATADFGTVGVVGLGLMGQGIAQAAATGDARASVVAYDADPSSLERGEARLRASVDRLVSRDRLSADAATSLLGRIAFTADVAALDDADLVIEAIVEDVGVKERLYADLGARCKPAAILASNTSSLSIGQLARASGRPAQFVGLHFFNPVHAMKLVEIVRTEHTAPDVFERTVTWVEQIGKVGVRCRDTPGFIVNRLLVPNLVQAMLLVERGDASVRDVDLSMQLGAGHPMGPLHLADYIGLDTCLFIMEGWVRDFPKEPAFLVPKSLRAKVEKNDLGRKTGKGFYHWDGEKRGDPV